MNRVVQQAVLRKTYRLIQSGWIQGCMARDGDGKPVGCFSELAVAFCLQGALQRAGADLSVNDADSYAVYELLRNHTGRSLIMWNDFGRTKTQVLHLLQTTLQELS